VTARAALVLLALHGPLHARRELLRRLGAADLVVPAAVARVRALQALLAAVALPVEIDPVEIPAEGLATDLKNMTRSLR